MKKLILSIAIILGLISTASPLVASEPVFAEGNPCTCQVVNADGSVTNKTGHTMDAAILSDVCECGGGEGVKAVIKLVINIFTVVIGIVGAIGISIAGIQYLTAGGNEEQTRKAKRRIFEIVIGFAAYAVIYLALSFLLPNFGAS